MMLKQYFPAVGGMENFFVESKQGKINEKGKQQYEQYFIQINLMLTRQNHIKTLSHKYHTNITVYGP